MKLKSYPKYKNSGIDWISEIPDVWEVHKLKYLLKIPVTDGPHETPEFIDEGIPFLSVDSIQDGKLIFENCRNISEEDHIRYKKKCNPTKGDIFLGKAASIGKIAIVNVGFEFSIWSPLALLRPDNKLMLSRFLEYALKSDYSQNQIEILATSNTQNNISMDDIPRIQIIVSPLRKQISIADFLDKKTAEIDELIEKDKKLIELLKEKRTALINHAVTKGLDPNVKMKDSGIEWIGKIPEGWEVKKLKFVSKLFGRIGFRGYTVADLVEEGKGALVIGGKHISNDNKLDLTNPEYLSWKKYYESPEIMVNKGNVIITQRGTLGKSIIIEEDIGPTTINPSMILIKKIMLVSKYLYCFLISDFSKKEVELITYKTAVPMISQEQANNLTIIIPKSKKEQIQIIQYLDEETKKIGKTIQKIEQKIIFLEEYKKSLIHHVVTGKVDVREV